MRKAPLRAGIFILGKSCKLRALVLVLVQSLLGFLHRTVANVTGVARAEHVLAIQVGSHIVFVAGQVEAEATAEFAFLRPLRVHVHSVCQRIQVKLLQKKTIYLTHCMFYIW